MSATEAAPPYLRPVAAPGRPKVPTPPGACDSHFHVLGPASQFPYSPDRAYLPADAPLEDALRMHAILGIQRGVVIQPNPHGTDNSALLDALEREPLRLRGVAIVKEDAGVHELRRLRDTGVRGLRFHHRPRMAGRFSAAGLEAFARLSAVMKDLGLHVQIFMSAEFLPELLSVLRDWNLPVVLDHFASADAAAGIENPAFRHLSHLLAEGRLWVKLSAAYRISENHPDYDDARLLHEALISANPDQLLWGSDWPHTRLEDDMPDDGHLLDLFNDWTGSAALRRKVLVDNPARLYGFS